MAKIYDVIILAKFVNHFVYHFFAGSPWTIFCYAVEGKGSKSFDTAKGFCFYNPVAAHTLLQKITDTTILEEP